MQHFVYGGEVSLDASFHSKALAGLSVGLLAQPATQVNALDEPLQRRGRGARIVERH